MKKKTYSNKSNVSNETDFEKDALLMWGKMSLKPGLEYNLKEDYIEEYYDLGDYGEREQRLA